MVQGKAMKLLLNAKLNFEVEHQGSYFHYSPGSSGMVCESESKISFYEIKKGCVFAGYRMIVDCIFEAVLSIVICILVYTYFFLNLTSLRPQ